MDYAAATVQKSGVRVFVNPAYEKKSRTWKAMYRAGKLPTATLQQTGITACNKITTAAQ